MTAATTIEAYIEGLDDWRGPVVRDLVELVRATAPEATGSIKWAQPVFESNGPAIWVRAYPRTASIGFWRGAEMDDPDGLLLGEGDRMRHVTVAEGQVVPREAVARYVRQAIALNAAKGNPTSRRRRD